MDEVELKELLTEQGKAFEGFKNDMQIKLDTERKEREELEARLQRANLTGGVSNGKGTAEQLEEKEVFLNEFIRKGRGSNLPEKKDMSVGSDPDGGYAVPELISSDIEKHLRELSSMRQVARVINVAGGTYKQLLNVGGITSGWVGETASRPKTDTPRLEAIIPPIGEIYANPAVTQHILDDAVFNVGEWLVKEIAEEFSVQENAAFISGTGGVKPKGLLSGDISTDADSTRTHGELQYIVTGVNGAFPTTNPIDKLIDLVQSLRPPYRANASWLMSSTTLFMISKFKDGNGNMIFQPSLAKGLPSTLLGYPVYEEENMPDPDTDSLSIAFGDFMKGYLILDRNGPMVLRDPYTNKGFVHFYTIKRVGGHLINDQAIKLLKFGTS